MPLSQMKRLALQKEGAGVRVVAASGNEIVCGVRAAARGAADDAQVVTYRELRTYLGIDVGDSIMVEAYDMPTATAVHLILTEPGTLDDVDGDLLRDYVSRGLLDMKAVLRSGDA